MHEDFAAMGPSAHMISVLAAPGGYADAHIDA
jgi:hypothetical protein